MVGAYSDDSIVVGVDVGGTNTRALVVDASGRTLGTARGSAGNPTGQGIETAARVIATVVADALTSVVPSRVDVVAVCGAGSDEKISPGFHDLLVARLAERGVSAPLRVRSDLEASFAAGTAATDGYVLIAGTGAVAGRITDNRLAAPTGGEGWLLGDEGGGFWLGREAIRAALSDVDGRGAATVLTARVARQLDVPVDRDAFLRWAYAGAPTRLGALAPLVTQACRDGDAVAISIADTAAAALVHLVRSLAPPADSPLVLAGGVLAPDSPVHPVVTAALSDLDLRWVDSGSPGAAWLAIRALTETAPPPALHQRLTTRNGAAPQP